MIASAAIAHCTLRLLDIPAGVDPAGEPLLAHAGVLFEDGASPRPAWDGATGPAARRRRFLTSTENDLTRPELEALAARFGGRPGPALDEARAARVAEILDLHDRLLLSLRRDADAAPEP